MSSYDEMKEHTLFGLDFMATREEQRDLWLKLCLTTESQAWGIAHKACYHGTFDPTTPQGVRLVTALENSEVAMTKLCHRLIGEMIARRDA